jgi:ribosomal protein L11 methyltransferase
VSTTEDASGWVAVDLTLPGDADEALIDVLSGALFELGAGGIETKDGDRPIHLVASFGPDVDADALPEAIGELFEAHGLAAPPLTIAAVPVVDWETQWREHFKPMAFGPLWVVPTWLEPPAEARHVIRLDPGMAFGTGAHETTALCLERIAELSPVSAVLDVGTGTGILAFGALLLGAERAVGTDNDPEALRVADENAALNGLADRLVLTDAEPDGIGEQFPLVVANILSEPLIAMAPKLASRVAPGGTLVLSGVLGVQAEDVARAYEAAGLVGRVITPRNEWVRIELRAPA